MGAYIEGPKEVSMEVPIEVGGMRYGAGSKSVYYSVVSKQKNRRQKP